MCETVGETLAKTGVISEDFATERQLSTLTVPDDHQVADTCTDEAADFGLTRELASMTPYAVPQEWAAAFDAHFAGIRYQTRFTTGPNPNAVGLFGDAGEASCRSTQVLNPSSPLLDDAASSSPARHGQCASFHHPWPETPATTGCRKGELCCPGSPDDISLFVSYE